MARLARVVAAGVPHHITQRGNRRQQTFFSEADYSHYRRLMAEWCARLDVAIWAYCLMPNHVHLIAVPAADDGLRRAIGEAHRRYSRQVNFRQGWRGYLWQGRFASFPVDGDHLLAAARYIELNPVRAGLVSAPEDWPWSSARAHLAASDDELARTKPLLDTVGDWRALISIEPDEDEMEVIRRHERTGRPLGDEAFVERLEDSLGRPLRPRKPGPKLRKTGGDR
ncbi:MAG: transposase [Defluviicoccus sp.]